MDANAKLGNKVIKGDPHEMSANGQILFDIIKRQNLFLVNSSELCNGIITRERETVIGVERSVIDYILVSELIKPLIIEMNIDEERVKTLTKFASKKGHKKIKTSDHNVITGEFSIPVFKNQSIRKEIYTLRDENDLAAFKVNTENEAKLIDCFNNEDEFIDQANK